MNLVLAIIGIAAGVLLAGVVMLWLHKRFARRTLTLIGQPAHVETALNPAGSVIVRGEIWRARSVDGSIVASRNTVRVVGAEDLYLMVESL